MNSTKNIAIILKDLTAYETHVKPIIDNAPNNEYCFFILHINKYYSKSNPIDSRIKFIDVSVKKNIYKIFSNYQINFIISINPGNIFDLFLISVAKINKIPTAYYQHGVQLDFTSFDPNTLFRDVSLKKRISSLKKYIFFYYMFIYNIFISNKKIYLLKTVLIKTFHVINKKELKNLPKYGLINNHVDYAFMYGEVDKNYLISSMNMNPKNIFITGYPFVAYNKYMKRNKLFNNNQKKTALYLSTALRTVGVIPITIKEEKEFYNKVYNQVKKAGYKLILKLHPCEDEELFNSYFENNDVDVIRLANLSDLTHEIDLVIGEYTTTFFYPIREQKPIILINSPYFKQYPFDFIKFGIGVKTDIDKLTITINENKILSEKDKLSYKKFSKNYINYNQDESSYYRLFNNIHNILNIKKF